ncbi:hypothetical protein KQH51_04695 [bacterium]|nr:hypothetical protein [bacterium]MCB2202214.1 hypothetical protein [bacterium]
MSDSFFDNDPQQKPTGDIPDLNGQEEDREESHAGAESELRTDEGRLAAIMSYIPFLCFVPLLSMKENREARFHARQGMVLFIIELVAVLFLLPGVSSLVFRVILIGAAGLAIAGIYFALQGKNYKLPIVGDLADKTKF